MNSSIPSSTPKKPISLGFIMIVLLIIVIIGFVLWKTSPSSSFKKSSSKTSIETKGLLDYILKTNSPKTILEIEPSDLSSQLHEYCKDYNDKNYAALESENPRSSILTVGNYIHKTYAPLINQKWHYIKSANDESISRLVRSSDGWDFMILPASRLRDIVDARKHAHIVMIRNASKNNQHLQKILKKYKTVTFVEPDSYLLSNS